MLLSFGIDGSGRILLLHDTFNADDANGDVVGSSSLDASLLRYYVLITWALFAWQL